MEHVTAVGTMNLKTGDLLCGMLIGRAETEIVRHGLFQPESVMLSDRLRVLGRQHGLLLAAGGVHIHDRIVEGLSHNRPPPP